jgi:hypothetical protein
MLAMALYPNLMRKAQHAIDVVVGRGHLPAFSYAPNFPYLRAMIMEVATRWTIRLVVRRLVNMKGLTVLSFYHYRGSIVSPRTIGTKVTLSPKAL